MKELIEGEDVHILVHDTVTEKIAEKELKNAGATSDRVHLHGEPNNFSWARESWTHFPEEIHTGETLITH